MLLKLCAKCGAATPNHNAICDRCAERLPAMQRERHAGYDKHRDPAKVAFYRSAAWRTLRLRKLFQFFRSFCVQPVSARATARGNA